MKIERPFGNKKSRKLTNNELRLHLVGMLLALKFSWAPLPIRWFFRRCPRTFAEGRKLKALNLTDMAEQVPSAIQSSKNAQSMAELAMRRGYVEEAGALFVTAARLYHIAYSTFVIIEAKYPSVVDMKRGFLRCFEGLGAIRALPGDDLEYWQDRLAEVLASDLIFGVGKNCRCRS